ncbi:ATP-binding protein [Krasilnikovia sp. MM14-A1004]|uniref:ATP-binding protein n=1 Tax=Krasilnikovia sp. MM14-A1004 TaxID=3373541 RepID=UPI00399D2E56
MRRDQSPFLLANPRRVHAAPWETREPDQAVTVVGDFDTALTEVELHGRWDPHLKASAAHVLRTCLVGQPAGIIADLHDLADPGGESAPLWCAAHTWGAHTPSLVPVVVCLPTAAPLAALITCRAARWNLPVYASLPEARAALRSRAPRTDRLTLHLAPDIDALPLVTQTIGEACAAWHMLTLHRTACAVLTELVANAIEHAGTRIDVAVTRRPSGLHLAVQDHDPRLPHLAGAVPGDPGDSERHGYGLRLVHTSVTAWGALPTRTGKIVWAVLTAKSAGERNRRRPSTIPGTTAPRRS